MISELWHNEVDKNILYLCVLKHFSMNTMPIFSFLKELTRCDYTTITNGVLEDFTYNNVTYAQGAETYQRILADSFTAFKACVLEASLQNKDSLSVVLADFRKAQQETSYDIPDSDYIKGMENDARNNDNRSLRQSIREAYFLNEMVRLQKWYIGEAIDYLAGFSGEEKKAQKKVAPTETIIEQESKLSKRLSEYGEFLTVADLTQIFDCVPRTITNWEKDGIIVNVAKKSDEINAVGHRKRGQEKRYRTEAVMRSVVLQEKFNEKN